MPPARPPLIRRILNRVFPFPLVWDQENRLADQEKRILELEALLQQMKENVETVLIHASKKSDASRWNLGEYLEAQKPAPPEIACILCDNKALPGELKTHETECLFAGGRLVRHEYRHCGAIFGQEKILPLTSRRKFHSSTGNFTGITGKAIQWNSRCRFFVIFDPAKMAFI